MEEESVEEKLKREREELEMGEFRKKELFFWFDGMIQAKEKIIEQLRKQIEDINRQHQTEVEGLQHDMREVRKLLDDTKTKHSQEVARLNAREKEYIVGIDDLMKDFRDWAMMKEQAQEDWASMVMNYGTSDSKNALKTGATSWPDRDGDASSSNNTTHPPRASPSAFNSSDLRGHVTHEAPIHHKLDDVESLRSRKMVSELPLHANRKFDEAVGRTKYPPPRRGLPLSSRRKIAAPRRRRRRPTS
mmetsp:Transcript_20926/g.33885  ORF Transcript_20926/g.33885 Transcript_20926/m.33885 type:complete len:246 (+) Transcript_20926:51-788(+)